MTTAEGQPPVELVAPGDGEALAVVGDVITVKLDRRATGGAYSVFEEVTDPGGGPPPHRHAVWELFYVLEGEVEFIEFPDEGGEPTRVVRGGPGAVATIPSNRVHTFRNAGSTRSRVLFMCVPSGLEDFFRAIGAPVSPGAQPAPPEGPPDVAWVIEQGQKYGVEFVGLEG